MRKIFKDTITAILIIVASLMIMGLGGYLESTYDMIGVVEKADNGSWLIEDSRGHIWEYESDELYEGENVKITFFDNHTHKIYDDEIVKVKALKNHK
ncbi:MAG: hypothetical protein LIR50_14665 [Bacillota bacterium]|nr:hypothetical protein [Bacillota bacterium]